MEKIVAILGKNRRDKIFRKEMLEELGKLGDLALNEDPKDPKEEDILDLVKGGSILITSWGCPKITDRILEQMPDLKLIMHAAGSVKGIISEEIWKRNIRVVNSASVLGKGVAETALGLTIASLKNFWNLRKDTQEGLWDMHIGQVNEVYQKKIGILGAGWAGKHYIQLMKSFSVELLLADPFISEEEACRMGVRLVNFNELLEESDVISIHAPSIPETYHMFQKETLTLMKKDAVLINTARGSIIDEQALFEHMNKGNLKYACLDVRDLEPPSPDDKLRTLPNVILTPHIAGLTNNGLSRIGDFAVNQIQHFLKSDSCSGEVLEDMMKTMA